MATGRKPGRPPKPLERKIAEGNKGHRPLKEAEYRGEKYNTIPPTPEHFKEDASKLWKQVWIGGKTWLTKERDFLIVQLLCETWEEYCFLRRMLKLGSRAGGVDRVTYTSKGYPVQHPYVSMLKQTKVELNTYTSSLGFSAADFARLQIAEIDSTEKQLIENLLSNGKGRR